MKIKYFLTLITSIFCLAVFGQQVLISEDFSSPTDSVTLSGWSNTNLNSNPQLFWFGYNPRNYDVNPPMSGNIALFDQNEWLFDAVVMDVVLESPSFDASGAGTFTLTFDHYFRSGGNGSAYSVEVYNGSVWDTITWADTSSSPNPPSGTYTTTSESHDITALTGGSPNAKVRFRYYAPVFAGVYWLIDNIEVQQSGCPPPANLSASNITTSSADISWTAGGAPDFNVEYGTSGFSPGSGTMVNTTSPSTTLSGLSPNTEYEFYVRDSCGMGMVSNWVGPFSFTTLCTPFTAPYSENFDNAVVQPEIPACWTNLVQSTTQVSYASTFGTGSNYVSAPNAIVFYNGPGSSASDFISVISPEFSDLTSNVNRVRFQAQTADGSSLLVGTMSDRTDSSTFVLAGIVPGGMSSYSQVTVDLTNVPAGHKYVAFVHSHDNGQDYIYMDDVNYEVIPCNQTAGTGSFSTVCGSNSAVNLASALSGADTGGVFVDTDGTGALTDSIFDATAVAPGNSYSFTYVLSQAGCPNDSALITINVEEPTNAGMDAQDTICHSNTVDLSTYLSANAQPGGNWVDVSGSGALSGNIFDLSQVASNADYSFEYVVSGATCANDTALIEINVADQAVAGADVSDTICDTVMVDLSNYLSANAQANGTWLDVNGTGALSGSNFDANQVANNTSYLFEYWVSTAQCDDTAQVELLVQDCSIGIQEFESNSIVVYPNPSSGRVNIEQTEGGSPINMIEVISLSGQTVYRKTVNSGEKVEIDLSAHARGVYNLKVVTEEGIHIQRIVKQ